MKEKDMQLWLVIIILIAIIIAIPNIFKYSNYENISNANESQFMSNKLMQIKMDTRYFEEKHLNVYGDGKSEIVTTEEDGQHVVQLNHDMKGVWTGANPWYTAKEIISFKIMGYDNKAIGSINMEFYPTQVVNWTGSTVRVSINEDHIKALMQNEGAENLAAFKHNYKVVFGKEATDDEIMNLILQSFKNDCNIVQNMCIANRSLTKEQRGCFNKEMNDERICAPYTIKDKKTGKVITPSCASLGYNSRKPCYNPNIQGKVEEGITDCTWVMKPPVRGQDGNGKRNVFSSENKAHVDKLHGRGLYDSDIKSHYNAGQVKPCEFKKGGLTIKHLCDDGTDLGNGQEVQLTEEHIKNPPTFEMLQSIVDEGKEYLGFSYSKGGKPANKPTGQQTKVSIQDITKENLSEPRALNFFYKCEVQPEDIPKPKECPPNTTPGGSSSYIIPPLPDDKSELMIWTSKPKSYGEIKNNTYSEGRITETWNAMAGLPHDEKLFLDVGASAFSMSIASDKYKLDVLNGPTSHQISGTASDYCWYETSYIPVCDASPLEVMIDACTGRTWNATCPYTDSDGVTHPGRSGGYIEYVAPNWHEDFTIHPLQVLNHKVTDYDIRGISLLTGLLKYTDLVLPISPNDYVNITVEESEPKLEFSGLPDKAPDKPIWQEEIWRMDAINLIKEAYPNSSLKYTPRKFDITVSIAGYSKTYKVLQDVEVNFPATQEAQPGNHHLAYKAEYYEATPLGIELGSNHEVDKYLTSWVEAVGVEDYGSCPAGEGRSKDDKPEVENQRELTEEEKKVLDDNKLFQDVDLLLGDIKCQGTFRPMECIEAENIANMRGERDDVNQALNNLEMIDLILSDSRLSKFIPSLKLEEKMNSPFWKEKRGQFIRDFRHYITNKDTIDSDCLKGIGSVLEKCPEYNSPGDCKHKLEKINNYNKNPNERTKMEALHAATSYKYTAVHVPACDTIFMTKDFPLSGLTKLTLSDNEMREIWLILGKPTDGQFSKKSRDLNVSLIAPVLNTVKFKPSASKLNTEINNLANSSGDCEAKYRSALDNIDHFLDGVREFDEKTRILQEWQQGKNLPEHLNNPDCDLNLSGVDESRTNLASSLAKPYTEFKKNAYIARSMCKGETLPNDLDDKFTVPSNWRGIDEEALKHVERLHKLINSNKSCKELNEDARQSYNKSLEDRGKQGMSCSTARTKKKTFTEELITNQAHTEDQSMNCGIENKIFRYMYWEVDGDPDTTAAQTNFLPIAKSWDPEHHIDVIGFKDFASMGSRRGADIPLFYKTDINITDIPNGQKISDPLIVEYKWKIEDPKLPSELYKKFGESDQVIAESAARARYHDETDKINDIIVHDPISISKVKIDPEELSDHRVDEQKRWLPVKLHPDSYFTIEFEHKFLNDGTIGKQALMELTDDKSMEYKTGLDTTKYFAKRFNEWKIGDPMSQIPGRFIIAPSPLWRVIETAPDKFELDKKSDGTPAKYEEGEVIPLDTKSNKYTFFVPLKADEFKANDILTFVVADNNVQSLFDPHVDDLQEYSWARYNWDRFHEGGDKSEFRADHLAMRNRTVDMVGRIGNFTWNYSKDPLWQPFFREPSQPKEWLINKIVYKPDMYKLKYYVRPSMDAYDNKPSLLDRGIGINRFFQEDMYKNTNGKIGEFKGEINKEIPVNKPKSSKLGYPIYYTYHTVGQRESTIPTVDVKYIIKCPKFTGQANMYVSKRGGTFAYIGPGAQADKIKEFLLHTKLSEYKYNPLMKKNWQFADTKLHDIYLGTPFEFKMKQDLMMFNGKDGGLGGGETRSQKWFGMWNLPSSTKFTKQGSINTANLNSKDFMDMTGCEMTLGYHIISDNGIWKIHTDNHPSVSKEDNAPGDPPKTWGNPPPRDPYPPNGGDPKSPPDPNEKPNKPTPPGDNTPPPSTIDIGEPAFKDQDITGTW